jgi:hypothetical protein
MKFPLFKGFFKRFATMEILPVEKSVTQSEQIEETEVAVSNKKKSPANQEKVDIMVDLLKVARNEDIDTFFIAFCEAATQRGFNLKGEPFALISQIDAKYH